MANNILEQLAGMWQQLSSSYNYLFQIYQHCGYLTPNEARYAEKSLQRK